VGTSKTATCTSREWETKKPQGSFLGGEKGPLSGGGKIVITNCAEVGRQDALLAEERENRGKKKGGEVGREVGGKI